MYVTTKFSVRPCENGHLLIFLRKSQKWWILSFSCLVFGFYFCASLIPLVVFFLVSFLRLKTKWKHSFHSVKLTLAKNLIFHTFSQWFNFLIAFFRREVSINAFDADSNVVALIFQHKCLQIRIYILMQWKLFEMHFW